MSGAGKSELNIRATHLKLIEDGVKALESRVGYPSMRKIWALTFVPVTRVPSRGTRVPARPEA